MRTGTGLSAAAVLLGTALAFHAKAQTQFDRFRISGQMQTEQPSTAPGTAAATIAPRITEAPTGFDNLTNGFLPQGPDFDTLEESTVVPLRSFNDDRFLF